MEIGTARRMVSFASIVVIASVVVMVVPAFVSTGDVFDLSDPDMSVSVDGAFASVDADIDVRSHAMYDLSDLGISVWLRDDINGSKILLMSAGPLDITFGDTVHVNMSQRFFLPTLYLILSDLVSRDGSVLYFEIAASGDYIMGLLGVDVSTVIQVPLAEDGSVLSVATMEDSDTVLSVRISGLRENLHPDDASVTVSTDDVDLTFDLTDDGGDVLITISSPSGLDGAIGSLTGSDEVLLRYNGDTVQLSTDQVSLLVSSLKYLRGSR